MKFFLTALLVFAAHAMAETGTSKVSISDESSSSESSLHLTPMVGPNFMAIKGDVDSAWDPSIGFSGGGFAELGSGYVTFQPGLLFNNYNSRADIGPWTMKLEMDYVSVPLFGKINFMGNPNRTVFLKAGLEPSFLASKSLTLSGPLVGDVSTHHLEIKPFDLPAIVGLGGAVSITKRLAITFEFDYIRGLLNIDDSATGGSVHNEGYGLLTGVSFAL